MEGRAGWSGEAGRSPLPISPPHRTHRELAGDDVEGLAGIALREGLAEARDGGEALLDGGLGLAGDDVVGLALLAALGVADDAVGHAHVLEEGRGGLAGVGARGREGVLRDEKTGQGRGGGGRRAGTRGMRYDGASHGAQREGDLLCAVAVRPTGCSIRFHTHPVLLHTPLGRQTGAGRGESVSTHLGGDGDVLAETGLEGGEVDRGGREGDLGGAGDVAGVEGRDELLRVSGEDGAGSGAGA
jgi:hypothetical protein